MRNATDIQTLETIFATKVRLSRLGATGRRATRRRHVHSRRVLLTMILLALPGLALADNGQSTDEGATALAAPLSRSARIAAQVQSFYDRTDTLQTRFTQSYYHALYRNTERATGTLILDKPGRMRFDYSNGKVMVASSGYLTMYEPGDDGEVGQYAKMRSSSDTTHQGFAFLMGHTRIDEDYNYRLLDAERYGWRGSLLELRPKTADAGVRRVLLYVDGRPGREGVVHRIRIDDHDGNRNTLTFRAMRFNRVLSAERFRYQPPAGAVRMQ
ncbi:MAG: outer membrane lipoprotein carrier protein [Polyangiales bacterium]|jgi:outer membrane lipoprotein carrier protein